MNLDMDQLIRRHMTDPNALREHLANIIKDEFTWHALNNRATLSISAFNQEYTDSIIVQEAATTLSVTRTLLNSKHQPNPMHSSSSDDIEGAIDNYATSVADEIVAAVGTEIQKRERTQQEKDRADTLFTHLTTRHGAQRQGNPE